MSMSISMTRPVGRLHMPMVFSKSTILFILMKTFGTLIPILPLVSMTRFIPVRFIPMPPVKVSMR